MKIYTKTGDSGKTSLYSGERVPKNDVTIACLGSIDQLNASLGVVTSQLKQTTITDDVVHRLHTIQRKLLLLGSSIAGSTLTLDITDVTQLEESIDYFTNHLPQLTSFILPGGSVAASSCHMSRTICRQTERIIVTLNEANKQSPIVLQYINRLSDYLFTLARYINMFEGAGEITWDRNTR